MILNEEERKKVFEKMEKLLEHVDVTGGRTANINEVAVANEKIKQLIDEYGISLEEVKGVKSNGTLISKIEINTYRSKTRKWIGSLAVILSDFYECKCIKFGSKFIFVGFNLDCEIVSEVFRRLYIKIKIASKISAVNRSDFSFGAVIALRNRLEEIKKERMKVSNVTALVVVKKDEVNKSFDEMFPNTVKCSRGKFRHSSDFYRGVEYGKTVEIFKSVKE